MTQTTLDLRAALAALADEPAATDPTPVVKSRISKGRQNLVHTMMLERYPAEVVAERFPKIDWANMTVADFNRRFEALKAIPKLEKAAPVKAAPAKYGRQDITPGRYTIVFEDESYLTLRVTLQAQDAEFMPGSLIISMLTGSDNENDYTRIGHMTRQGGVRIWSRHQNNAKLREAVEVLVGDPIAAVKAYALVSGRCGYCNLVLTTPDSIAAGCGEKCASDHGIPYGK